MADQTSRSSDQPSDSPLAAGWGFWLLWVLASTVGSTMGGLVIAVGSYRDMIVAGYVGVVVGGIMVGMLQWLVLRRQVAGAGWWVPASLGAAVVVGVVVFGVGTVNVDVGWVVGVILFGPVVGGLQWLVLRRHVARAGRWVLASTVGWVVGGFLSGAVPVGGFLGWTVLGAVYGAITGSALVGLLRQRPPAADA